MKPNLVLLQLLAVAAAGSPLSLPEGMPFLSRSSWEGMGLPVDLADGRFGQLPIERRSRAGAPMGADKAAVYIKDTDGTGPWQRSVAVAGMDAGGAVVVSGNGLRVPRELRAQARL